MGEMMAEKLDLDGLKQALINSAMGLTFRECHALIDYAQSLEADNLELCGVAQAADAERRALESRVELGSMLLREQIDKTCAANLRLLEIESRASNAGGAVAEPVTDWNAWITDASRDEYIEAFLDTLAKAADRETERYMTRWFMGGWPMWVNAHPKRGLEPVGMPVGYTPAPASKEPVADEPNDFDSPLSDFQEGQWWINELDAWASTGTDDQKRAIAVVHHMLRSARAALATAQTWQPIETAPKDGRAILGALPGSDVIQPIMFRDGQWLHKWDHYALNGASAPTHWMPLPAAPAKPEGVR